MGEFREGVCKVTRRGFMQGAAVSFAVMKASTALGSEANGRVRAGLVGFGSRGKMIAEVICGHGGYELFAVADYFPEVAQGAVAKHGVAPERCFGGLSGYKRLLESGVDAVFLETPPYCFPDHVAATVAAGRHVYMAKPIACDVPGVMAVADAAKKATGAGKVFLVDFQTRTDPLIAEGIQRVRSGEIGALSLLSSVYNDESFADPPLTATVESRLQELVWVNDVALGGGYLVNAGIHAVDVALWVAGSNPVSATGSARTTRSQPHGDSSDVYSLTYEFEDGLIFNHRGEHLRNRSEFLCECVSYCQEGHLRTGYDGLTRMLGNRVGWRGGEVKELYHRGAVENVAAFHRNVVGGICDNPTVEPSVNATLATILGREAGRNNTKMTWAQLLTEAKRCAPDLTGLKE